MRIAAFPKGYLEELVFRRTRTIDDWIAEAVTLKVDGVELHPGMLWDKSPSGIARVGDLIAATGMEMPMMCASPDFTHPDADQRRREIDTQIELMGIVRTLGGPGASCRVLSGQRHDGVRREDGVEWAVNAIKELIPIAREMGIVLSMENHYKASTWTYPEFAQRPEIFREIVDQIEERVVFGIQFDPSNAVTAGVDSADFLESVIDRVITMQASDRFLEPGTTLDDLRQADGTIGYSPALKHGVIGHGLNDYDRIFGTLVAAGYDGWISIEDGINGPEELQESAAFLRDARDRWFNGSRAVHVAHHEAAKAAAAHTATLTTQQ